jgi:hypothetical protein
LREVDDRARSGRLLRSFVASVHAAAAAAAAAL